MALDPEIARRIDGDTAGRIVADVGNGVSIEDSRLTYNADMEAYRREIEADVAAMPSGAILDIPSELPPLDVVIPERRHVR